MSETSHRAEILDQRTINTTKENPTSSNPRSPSASPEEWSTVSPERVYYNRDGFFIKRSLRPSEYITNLKDELYIPRLGKARLQNEAGSLRFICRVSNIPVPTVYGAFEVDGSFFLILEYIDGVNMADLSADQKKIVRTELQQHLATLQTIKSSTLGGPSGLMIPPYRVLSCTENGTWRLQPSDTQEYVLCHKDLSQHNVIVDPQTLKINAIIDWEYAGFFPPYFEAPFYERVGPQWR